MKKWLGFLTDCGKACGGFFWDQVTSGLAKALVNTIVCLVLMIISFILGAWLF